MKSDIQEILERDFVAALVKKVCGDNYKIVTRPQSFIIKKDEKDEDPRNIHRLIILPPRGYTSNTPNQTNCFHSVEKSKIDIKGAVREGKKTFSKLKPSLRVVSFNSRAALSDVPRPYLEFDVDNLKEGFVIKQYDAGTVPFYVVKPDGTGFYHTLINPTNDWIVLELHKVMAETKPVDLESHIATLQDEQANVLRNVHQEMVRQGDVLLDRTNPDNRALIVSALSIPPAQLLPALGEMLYTRDTGPHEPCTAFGLILDVAQKHPKETLSYLREALQNKKIPLYFAEQLIGKVERKMAQVRPQKSKRSFAKEVA